MKNTVKSATSPIHPGEILLEEFMRPLGISSNALAPALRVPALQRDFDLRTAANASRREIDQAVQPRTAA
jgi:plasmid maintenance system antidote protein VapI